MGLVILIALIVLLIISRKWAKKNPKKEQLFSGIFVLAGGILLFIWARAHSPNMGFGQMLTKANSFILKEPFYYTVLFIAGLMVLGGVINLVKSLRGDGVASNTDKSLSGEGSTLDQIKKAKELLDAGAINADEFEKIKKSALGS
jgi:uncharacterized membrane protein HdeD (DUF308 family)